MSNRNIGVICEDCVERGGTLECSCGETICEDCAELHINRGHRAVTFFEIAY